MLSLRSQGVDPKGSWGEQELGGVETVSKIYCMRKESVFNKKKKREDKRHLTIQCKHVFWVAQQNNGIANPLVKFAKSKTQELLCAHIILNELHEISKHLIRLYNKDQNSTYHIGVVWKWNKYNYVIYLMLQYEVYSRHKILPSSCCRRYSDLTLNYNRFQKMSRNHRVKPPEK